MLRTAQVAQTPYHHRVAAIAVAALAIAAAAACGGDGDELRTVAVVPSAAPAIVPAPDSGGETTETGRVISPNISFEEAEAAFTERRYDEASEMFTVYTQRRPENPWGHYMLGLSAWKAGQLDRAQAGFEEALERDPGHVKSLLNLSRVLLDQNRPAEALTRTTAALAIDSTSSEGHRLMGRVRSALGQPDGAIESYRIALALDPEDTWSMNNMGLVLIQRGRYEEALRPLARAVQLDSGVAVFHNNLGIALERTGRFVAAAEAYRGALRADGAYDKASVSLARVEGRSDDPSVLFLDLATLGDEFAREVETWRTARLATQ